MIEFLRGWVTPSIGGDDESHQYVYFENHYGIYYKTQIQTNNLQGRVGIKRILL